MAVFSGVFVFFVFLTVTFALKPVNVTVKDTAVLPCTGATYRDTPADDQHVEWRKTESQLVARWSQGKFTPGPGYEGRVKLPKEGIKNGKFSLTISPVEYSDRGSYDCFRGFNILSVVNLEVSDSITTPSPGTLSTTNKTSDKVALKGPCSELFTLLWALLGLHWLLLLMEGFKLHKLKNTKQNYEFLLLLFLLDLGLLCVSVTVTVAVKPGLQELHVAVGVLLGLFLFLRAPMTVTWEKLSQKEEMSLCSRLKVVLLPLLLLVLSVTITLPGQRADVGHYSGADDPDGSDTA
ncbi:hypothetical protein GN956_G23816 [Arapaima gigas]